MITGTSSGFGAALATVARAAGHEVVATTRAGGGDLHLDLRDPESIRAAAAAAGDVDVLVNNAGFGLLGAFEELTDAELRDAFEVNLLGPLTLTRALLPGMRSRRFGRIVQLSSVVGVTSGPGGAAYAGPKAALEAASVALAGEVRHLGIRVTIVQPGPFRTAFGGAGLRWSTPLPDYAEVIGPPRAALEAGHGRQPNDPARGAAAILAAVTRDEPPLHLPLGPEAFDWIREYFAERVNALSAVRPLGLDTAYRPAP
ncbi:short-subunit dehydrogenase [Solirubrobacter pauli]|uniref:Short-subunit dehydrogenase n=2 Tax=Solirubrobacter pauli TaxID=166793 RepID=A0A660L3T7_9ACTN|nr:short-subunit dehydrogenase [Solirubrobacter pauli]